MERRQVPRIKLQMHVEVDVLTEPVRKLDCEVLDVSPQGLQLLAPEAIAISAPVKLDLLDAMMLAEVCHCAPVPGQEGNFRVGLITTEVLANLSDLSHLINALRREAAESLFERNPLEDKSRVS